MNSQTASPSGSSPFYFGCQIMNTTIMVNPPINNIGYFRFSPQIIGTFNSLYGYYFALDTTNSFRPLAYQSTPNNYCNTTNYGLCLTFPDINYIVIYVTSSSGWYVDIKVQYPNSVSQLQTNMVARVWNQYRYMGNQVLQVTTTCWNQLLSSPSSVSIGSTPGNSQDYYKGKRRL